MKVRWKEKVCRRREGVGKKGARYNWNGWCVGQVGFVEKTYCDDDE